MEVRRYDTLDQEKNYAINQLFDRLDDVTSALAHAEQEVAEAKRRYKKIKEELRKAIMLGEVQD